MRTGRPPNARGKLRIYGRIAFVPPTQGYSAVVDLGDLPAVLRHHWFAMVTQSGGVYARRNAPSGCRPASVLLHRELMATQKEQETDHINGNTLDNRRANLRNATRTQNGRNLRMSKANTSGVKGVYQHSEAGKWRARIMVNRRSIHLGVFPSLESASAAYDEAACRYFGEFARTNRQLQSGTLT